jgi:hypothetical protein
MEIYMMLSNLRKRNGYTIIEAVCCVAIATLALGSIAFFMNSGQFVAVDNRSHIYAVNGLREEMELIRDMSYSDVVLLGSDINNNLQLDKLSNKDAKRHITHCFGTVTDPDPNCKKITLRVTWTSPSGRSMEESITSFITKGGIKK